MSWTYLIYVMFWESLAWGWTAWAVVVKGYSPWLWLLAILESEAICRPEQWAKLWGG